MQINMYTPEKKVLCGFRRFLFPVITMLILLLHAQACSDKNESIVPKPRAYSRIDFPEKAYVPAVKNTCRFGFEIPVYAEMQDYTGAIEAGENNQCWLDISFPAFNGKIHCSYYPIKNMEQLDSLIYDSFALVGKHTIKAQYIKETRINMPHRVSGMLFNLSGPAASPTQFFLTDSLNHFFRGSLYFENKTQVDSMEIVYRFIDKDIEQLLNTFHWK